jgi:hypothetical protein
LYPSLLDGVDGHRFRVGLRFTQTNNQEWLHHQSPKKSLRTQALTVPGSNLVNYPIRSFSSQRLPRPFLSFAPTSIMTILLHTSTGSPFDDGHLRRAFFREVNASKALTLRSTGDKLNKPLIAVVAVTSSIIFGQWVHFSVISLPHSPCHRDFFVYCLVTQCPETTKECIKLERRGKHAPKSATHYREASTSRSTVHRHRTGCKIQPHITQANT